MPIELMLGTVIGFVAGFALSVWLTKFDADENSEKVKKLEAERDEYRKQVDNHFVNTAVLFKGLTDQYREVYRHIAKGAGELCSEEAKALHINLEETALLAHANEDVEPKKTVEDPVPAELPVDTSSVDDKLNKNPAKGEEDDDVPLASEVEMPGDIATEIKNQATQKH
ncbi:MAG: uncharacterized membrane-anchored protein YhcB (DUF1043 family) [Cycloclasticus sp.]|jgi:uncharacterized membrane-anchored protein YhcB (DUF1043 family)